MGLTDRRRLFAVVALPAALALALSSVAVAQDGAMAPDESVSGTVTFWNGYGADGGEITTFREEVLPAFNAAYPNITVDTQEIPYDDLRQKLVTGLAGGVLPDVLRADIIWVPEFADQGALLALDKEMSDFACPRGTRSSPVRSRPTSGVITTTACRSTPTPASSSSTTP